MQSTTSHWRRVESILDDLFDVSQDERPGLLAELCGEDDSVRLEVEELLAADRAAAPIFDSRDQFWSLLTPPVEPDVGDLYATTLDSSQGVSKKRTTRSARAIDAWLALDGLERRQRLGRGGSGIVFRAHEESLDRSVAIKVLDSRDPGVGRKRQTFIDEARLTAMLEHPNILPVHRLGILGQKVPYFSMRLVRGRSLHDWVLEQKPQLAGAVRPQLLNAFLRVCEAVSYAHSRGVVHCDLKPANVMVGQHGTVYLVDWGIARSSHESSANDVAEESGVVVVGTPAFMSPEQAQGRSEIVDERTDIFGLGAILFFLLTGEVLYEGRTSMHVLMNASEGSIRWPIDDKSGSIPPGLLPVLEKALATNMEDRHQSAVELRQDVQSYLHGELRAPQRSYAAGEIIVGEGERGHEAFVIDSGNCSVLREQPDGSLAVIRELGPGDVFGELAVFTDGARVATVKAMDEVVVRVVTQEVLTESLGLNTWLGSFITVLAERFRELDAATRDLGRWSEEKGS